MPTIIDSLVVQLGWGDAPKFKSGGDAAAASVKKVETTSDKATQSVKSLSKAVGSFLAIIGGTYAVKQFVYDFIDANSQLDRFSRNLGMSVSTVSAWGQATEQLGGSSQGLRGTLAMLSREQTNLMLTGQSGLIPYFSALGMSMADVEGKARPVDDILLGLADKFSRMNRTTANNMGAMMGIDQGTMNLLLQGRAELELEIRRQKEFNVVTKEQAEEATRLKRSLVDTTQTFAAFGRQLFMDATPALERLLEVLRGVGNWMKENRQFVGDFLKILAVGLGAIAIYVAPISMVALAVVGLAGAFALLWDDYQTWAKGADSAFDWGAFKEGIEGSSGAIKTLGDNFRRESRQIINAFKAIDAARHGDWKSAQLYAAAAIDDDPWIGAKRGIADSLAPNSAPQQATPQLIKAWFKSHGMTDAQAAGIAANFWRESSGNTDAKGDWNPATRKNDAYGLAQWHPDRQKDFKAWSGRDIRGSTLEQQLQFALYEMTKGSRSRVGQAFAANKGMGSDEAARLVSMQFEAPKDKFGEANLRAAYAQSLMGIPGASSVAASAMPAVSPNVSHTTVTNRNDIVINTQATDAQGIADELPDYLTYISQANTGVAN